MPVRAVTLDFWSTLVEDHQSQQRMSLRTARVLETLAPYAPQVRATDVERAFQDSWDNFDRVWHDEQRTPTAAESMHVVLDSLRVHVPDGVHAALVTMVDDLILEQPPCPVFGARVTLPKLADLFKLAVVSDSALSPGRSLRRVLEHHHLLEHFDYLFFSDEHGFSKPDPRAFETALDALGVPASEAVHVGDMQRTDVEGAHAAGMRALHFVGVNSADAARSSAEGMVYRFVDLPAAILRLG